MPRCTYRSTEKRARYVPSDCVWCAHSNALGFCQQLGEYINENPEVLNKYPSMKKYYEHWKKEQGEQ